MGCRTAESPNFAPWREIRAEGATGLVALQDALAKPLWSMLRKASSEQGRPTEGNVCPPRQ